MVRDANFDHSQVDVGAWDGFPITDVPRPIVLLAPPVELGQGFVDGDSKLAWLSGSIVAEVPLPAGVLELLTAGHNDRPSSKAVRITSAEHRPAEFMCDRGPRLLPAYRLDSPDLRDGCVVLDPAVDIWWPSPADSSNADGIGGPAQIDEDDLTLHIPAFGGVLTEFHHAEFDEYDTCVVGLAITTQRRVPPGTAVHLVGISKHVTGRLNRPLGGRVLLGANGDPMAVVTTPTGSPQTRRW